VRSPRERVAERARRAMIARGFTEAWTKKTYRASWRPPTAQVQERVAETYWQHRDFD